MLIEQNANFLPWRLKGVYNEKSSVTNAEIVTRHRHYSARVRAQNIITLPVAGSRNKMTDSNRRICCCVLLREMFTNRQEIWSSCVNSLNNNTIGERERKRAYSISLAVLRSWSQKFGSEITWSVVLTSEHKGCPKYHSVYHTFLGDGLNTNIKAGN